MELGLPPSYVLDEMHFYEAKSLIKNKHFKTKDIWEMTRFLAYITAQVQCTKKIEMKDILKFPWEEEEKKHTITKEEIEALQKKAEEYLNTPHIKEQFNG